MITIQNERQLAEVMRRIREYRGVTTTDLATTIRVDRRTVRGRDTGDQGYTLNALMITARALGYQVALIPLDEEEPTA